MSDAAMHSDGTSSEEGNAPRRGAVHDEHSPDGLRDCAVVQEEGSTGTDSDEEPPFCNKKANHHQPLQTLGHTGQTGSLSFPEDEHLKDDGNGGEDSDDEEDPNVKTLAAPRRVSVASPSAVEDGKVKWNADQSTPKSKKVKKFAVQLQSADAAAETEEELSRIRDCETKSDCNLCKLELSVIPDDLEPLIVQLTKIELTENKITDIPSWLVQVPQASHLTILDFSENCLRVVPMDLFLLPNVEVLLLDHNKLTSLPFDGMTDEELRVVFDVSPPSSDEIQRAYFHRARAHQDPVSSKQQGERRILPKARRVGLEWNQLEHFPAVLIAHCLYLEELYVAENESLLNECPTFEVFVAAPRHHVLQQHPHCTIRSSGTAHAEGEGGAPSIPRLLLKVDNRPRLVKKLNDEELWTDVCPWLDVSLNKIYPDKVLDFLYLGSLRTAQTVAVYRDLNIGFILTAGRFLDVQVLSDMEQLILNVDDLPGEDMTPLFEASFAFIEKARAARRGILIHCFAGLSRSVTIVVGYLMKTMYPMSRDEALALVRNSRPAARPNDGFLTSLLRYEKSLRELHGDL